MSYCHGLGHEMAAEKIPRNTVGMVGKKGISWHVSACITRTENTDMEFEVIGI